MGTAVEQAPLPEGQVTLLFTDIEGSTALLQKLGDDYGSVLNRHDEIMRSVWSARGGVEVDNEGDAFFVAFADHEAAVHAAEDVQRAFAEETWPEDAPVRIRMALHAGEPRVRGRRYWGIDVNYAARLCSAGHGGQVLLSADLRDHVPDLEVESLGRHGLRDFPVEREIFHLVVDGSRPTDFPPPRVAVIGRANLPTPPAPIIGREAEIADVCARLAGGQRLVTLVGPGGVGKTRLALACGEKLTGTFPDGVSFVSVAASVSVDDALSVLATEIDCPRPEGIELVTSIARHLADRDSLLILDNAEHIPDLPPVIAELLSATSGLRTLVTSQAPLHIRSEHVSRLEPLGVPSVDIGREEVFAAPAAQMLLERIEAVAPGFAVPDEDLPHLAALCRALEGLPLALELAAARAPVVGLATIRADLLGQGSADLPERQRGLEAALDWTVSLLEEDERILFEALASFAEAWSLPLAEELFAERANPEGTLRCLSRLVDLSLVVVRGDGRFTMAERVRRYAVALLAASGQEHHWRSRHATVVRLRFEYFEDRLDIDNIRASAGVEESLDEIVHALNWARAHDQEEYRRLLSRAFFQLYMFMRSPAGFTEDLTRLTQEARDDGVHCWLLLQAGNLESIRGDHERAQASFQRAAAWAEAHGEPEVIWPALTMAAWSAQNRDNPTDYLAIVDSARRRAIRAGRRDYAGFFESMEIPAMIMQGSYAAAERRLDELLRTPDRVNAVGALAAGHLADCAFAQGNYPRALAELAKFLKATGGSRYGHGIYSVTMAAASLALMHRDEEAAELAAGADHVSTVVVGAGRPVLGANVEVALEQLWQRLEGDTADRARLRALEHDYASLRERALEFAAR